jgi:hypothetical protein
MFAHPAYAAPHATSGCSCGCGTCSGTQPVYGATVVKNTEWAWDTMYYDSCPKYKEKVDAYEKARNKIESLPSFLGIRAGGRNSDVEKYNNRMKVAKREGENARRRCESKEYSTEGGPEALDIEQVKQQVGITGGGGEEDTGLGPLLYVGAAAVLAVGSLVVWKIVKRPASTKAPSPARKVTT